MNNRIHEYMNNRILEYMNNRIHEYMNNRILEYMNVWNLKPPSIPPQGGSLEFGI